MANEGTTPNALITVSGEAVNAKELDWLWVQYRLVMAENAKLTVMLEASLAELAEIRQQVDAIAATIKNEGAEPDGNEVDEPEADRSGNGGTAEESGLPGGS